MTPNSLNRNNSKWPKVQIFFILDLFLTKCVRCCFSWFFNQTVKNSNCLWWCFFLFSGPLGFIYVLYDSQTTNRSAAEGEGCLQRESCFLPIGRRGVIYDSLPHSNALFIAVRKVLRRIFQASLRDKRSKGYFVRHMFTLCVCNVWSVLLNKWWNGCNYLVYFRLFYQIVHLWLNLCAYC